MKRIALIILLFISISSLKAQDVIDKMSKQICNCLEKNEKKMSHEKAMSLCFEENMIGNYKELRKYYNVQSISEINTEDLGNKLSIKLLKNCEVAYKYFNKDSLTKGLQKNYTTDNSLICDNIKTGKYYYLTPNPANTLDTTHVTIDKENYLEIIGTNKTYSKLSIKWTDNCKFQLTFIESNDTFKNTLSKKGDKYEYEIIQNLPYMIVLKLIFRGDEYFIEYFKE